MIRLPSLGTIYDLHAVSLEQNGGGAGTISGREGMLESSISAVRNRVLYGKPEHPASLIALLCVRIAKAHAFVDGNKRTAASVLLHTLEENGFEIRSSDQMKLYMHLIAALEPGAPEEEFCSAIVRLAVPYRPET